MSRTVQGLRAGGGSLARTSRELAALEKMSVGELAEKYRELFGVPTRTRNKDYLRKRVAWRIQERAEGGLSPRALERIALLAPEAPVRWRQPVPPKGVEEERATLGPKSARDRRLPPPGTLLRRCHDGVEHEVTVLEDGFEYRGERHRSLSKIARLITGTPWNGFLFFFGRTGGTRRGGEEHAR